MTSAQRTDRKKLVEAARRLWDSDASIAKFRLHLIEDRVRAAYGGWILPVWPMGVNGNGREIVQELGRIQDKIEQRTKLSVSVMLDPGVDD